MFHYLSGLFLFSLDLSLICGQATQNNSFNSDVNDDNNSYVDQENQLQHYRHCSEEDMRDESETVCWDYFNHSMTLLGEENWCDIKKVVGSYNILTECLETTCRQYKCYYPNRVVEQLFVRIHQQYFHSCSDDDQLPDAPAVVVLAATLLPIILIPFIVYIVVWKSSLRE